MDIAQSLHSSHSAHLTHGHVTVSGTPACPGVVTGPAKIVTHINDADTIEPGDILITHSTDIGKELNIDRAYIQTSWI